MDMRNQLGVFLAAIFDLRGYNVRRTLLEARSEVNRRGGCNSTMLLLVAGGDSSLLWLFLRV